MSKEYVNLSSYTGLPDIHTHQAEEWNVDDDLIYVRTGGLPERASRSLAALYVLSKTAWLSGPVYFERRGLCMVDSVEGIVTEGQLQPLHMLEVVCGADLIPAEMSQRRMSPNRS
jgi:hypothetical protein